MKKFVIYHPTPGKNKVAKVELPSYESAKAEYLRLQELYPSREMALYAYNDYGDRSYIHSGRWD